MRVRLELAGRVLLSWAAPIVFLLLFGPGGVWFAHLLAIASAPLVGLALLVCLGFPQLIIDHPRIAGCVAAALSLTAGVVFAGQAGGLFGGLIALPALAIFLIITKEWPLKAAPVPSPSPKT